MEINDLNEVDGFNELSDVPSLMIPRNTDPVATIDHTFNRNGRTWRVTVVTDTFIIGTAIDAERDARGELVNDYDILKVCR